ncbi:hypothetical protein CLV42_10842 [Chitinophaga ginsengisoli]|uniref:Uncharacterized protein n=2 Tax=Chitinophaga ginsengisoli TaxID=363837 RepID=A0A2P8G2C2_9BACT|nr:hypothetical protein CLV42_10842 [Chitinophaga ginsengisoli]
MLNHIAFLINEEIPKQLRRSPVLNPRFVSQVMFGRFHKLESLDRKFLTSLKNSTEEETIRSAVKSCQYSIVPLMDKLIQWLPDNEVRRMDILDPDDEGKHLFKFLHQLLYDLHLYLEKNFYRYMDDEYNVPAYSRHLFQGFIMETLVTVKSSPRFRSLDSRLQRIVTAPLELSVSTAGNDYLSYGNRDYVAALANQLLGFVKRGNDNVWRLYNRLQYIDFNSVDYVRYLIFRFREECAAITNIREKYLWLIARRKKIAHQLVEEGTSFHNRQKSLKAVLDEWLKWEIYHTKRMLELETIGK